MLNPHLHVFSCRLLAAACDDSHETRKPDFLNSIRSSILSQRRGTDANYGLQDDKCIMIMMLHEERGSMRHAKPDERKENRNDSYTNKKLCLWIQKGFHIYLCQLFCSLLFDHILSRFRSVIRHRFVPLALVLQRDAQKVLREESTTALSPKEFHQREREKGRERICVRGIRWKHLMDVSHYLV